MDQLDGSADGGHADDGQPPMTKAQAQRADSLRRAREKRNKKRKRGGGSKKSSIPSRADGKNRKSGSYDFPEAAAAVGVERPNSQAIKSRLMPVVEPRPRKPTPEELELSNKQKDKEIKQLHKKVEEAEAKCEITVAKLNLSEERVAKLKQHLERKKAEVIELSDKLKEEKRSRRVLAAKLALVEKRAEDTAIHLRELQSDLIAVNQCADLSLKEAKEEHDKEVAALNAKWRHDKKAAARQAVTLAMEQARAKLDKAKEQRDMTQKNLQNLLNQKKAESKQKYLDSMQDLENVEKRVRSKFLELDNAHVSEMAEVKEESRRTLQDMSAKSKAKIEGLRAKVKELESINLELKHEATEERRAHRKAQKNAEKIAMLAARRLKNMQSAQAKAEEATLENEGLRAKVEDLEEDNEALREEVEEKAKLLDEYELIMKECSKIKDSEGRGGLSWPPWMVLLIIEFLVNGTSPSAIPDNIRTAFWTLYSKGPKEVPSVDFCRKCRTIADRLNECLVAMLIADNKCKTLHTDGTSRRQTTFETLILGLEQEDKESLMNIIVSSCIFMESGDAQGCVDGIKRKVCILRHVTFCDIDANSIHFALRAARANQTRTRTCSRDHGRKRPRP